MRPLPATFLAPSKVECQWRIQALQQPPWLLFRSSFLSSIHSTTNLSQQNRYLSLLKVRASGISNHLTTPSPSRLVMSGRCTATVVIGKITIPCPCLHGVFDVPLGTINTTEANCQDCAHLLSQHEDAGSSIAQDSLSQGMSSFIISIVADGRVIGPAGRPQTPLVDDPSESPRRDTVATLWGRIQEVGVVHVRGTPASGKSTLARLLEQYVIKKRPDLLVYRFSWPSTFPDGFWPGSQYHTLLNSITKRPLDQNDWWRMQVLLIIDEAQGSYEYISLWNDLIKGLSPTSGPLIALFSSYGSPSNLPLGDARTPTPIYFRPDQRISIRRSSQNPNLALLFSQTELSDVVERVCKFHSRHGQAFLLSPELIDYVWKITNGHPAGVRAVLDELAFSQVSIS
jgi:hypothetical protein